MNPQRQLRPKEQIALSTAIHYFCQVYWGPTEELIQLVLEKSFLRPLETISPLMATHFRDELFILDDLLNRFAEPDALFTYLEEGYVRLFINDRGGISAPLYASCYTNQNNPQLMGAAAVRMQRILTDLEIHVGDEIREPPDHLAIQLEVLYFLLSRRDENHHLKSITEAAHFTAEHVLPWIQQFNERLAAEVECRFYPLLTSVLVAVLHEIRDLGTQNSELSGAAEQ